MGGVGKTIIANQVCHDPRVRERFADGILWYTIGQQSDFSAEALTRRIAHDLNREFRDYSRAAYSSLFVNRRILVVLDDVWSQEAVEPFLIGPGESRLLYTSRNLDLAGPLGAKSVEVGRVDDDRARLYLARWVDRDRASLPDPQSTEIIAECKGLVLGLAMIGCALQRKPDEAWSDICEDLRNRKLAIGKRPAGYGYRSLHACIGASVQAFEPPDRDRYLVLAGPARRHGGARHLASVPVGRLRERSPRSHATTARRPFLARRPRWHPRS